MTQSDSRSTLTAADRRTQLARFVDEQGYCTIAELAQLFSVSEMTIRRDVSRLVDEARVRSFHGGVTSLAPHDLVGSEYTHRVFARGDLKWKLAQAALPMVESASTLALDAGTTIAALASQLPKEGRLQVVTASLAAVNALSNNPAVELTVLGGVLHPESQSFAGPRTVKATEDLQVDVLFLAASGLNARGAFCANDYDAVTKRALIAIAERVVLVADSSKFSRSAMAKICGWGSVDALVVDDGISAEDCRLLEDQGVEIQIVSAHDAAAAAQGK